MGVRDEERMESGSKRVLLLTSLFVGPIVWLLNFETSYLLVFEACKAGSNALIYLTALVSLALITAGGAPALRYLKSQGELILVELEEPSLGQFMAALGLTLNALFFIVIVAQTIAALVLNPCLH